MSEILREPVRDATAWRGDDIRDDPSWRVAIGEREREALLAGLKAVQAKGLWFHQMEAADFPLDDSLRALVADVWDRGQKKTPLTRAYGS
ncbi:MAG: hypothetical protein ACKORK_11045 [Gemmatimonadota bacterium]